MLVHSRIPKQWRATYFQVRFGHHSPMHPYCANDESSQIRCTEQFTCKSIEVIERIAHPVEVTSHYSGKSTRKSQLVAKYMPSDFWRFISNFCHRSFFFGPSRTSAIISPIVDDNSNHINEMPHISPPECFKRIVQQRKSNCCKELGPGWNKNVARSMVGGLGENRFCRRTVNDNEVFILKIIGKIAPCT